MVILGFPYISQEIILAYAIAVLIIWMTPAIFLNVLMPKAVPCFMIMRFPVLRAPLEEVQPLSQLGWRGFKNWLYRYRGLIAIAGLIIFSIALALNSQ